MPSPKSIKELLKGSGKRLTDLTTRTRARAMTYEHVCAALPPDLAQVVVSAGIEGPCLTIGVAGAHWAARMRYVTEPLREKVAASLRIELQYIRIKVVPPRS